MKRFLKILVVIILTLIVGSGSCAFYMYKKSSELEVTAIPYIEKSIPEISTWNIEVFKSYVTQESNDNTSDEELLKLLKAFSKLGALKEINEISLLKLSNLNYLTYRVETSYENGPATINR